jgi:hypothetical protein
MQSIADGSLRWAVVHWAAAAALSFFAIASLVALTAGSRLTQEWWTLSAWALLPVGALWTVTTAVAEATVIYNAAVTGNRAVYETWWMFAEGNGNGFAAMALAFTVVAANEARMEGGVTPYWASSIAAVAGLASFAGWVLGMWLGLAFGAPIWVVGSIVMCLWLVWFGLSSRADRGRPGKHPARRTVRRPRKRRNTMTEQVYGKSYGGTPAENYQRYFVPAIGAPVADDLIGIAGLQPGQRVLDVACGTGS